jgi:restriction endonuclease/NACHT domain-containing protein
VATESTTAAGNKFRSEISTLLQAAGFELQEEIRRKYKKIDIVARMDSVTGSRTIFIEVKKYAKPLTKDDCHRFIVEYEPFVRGRAAHESWLISASEFSPDARALVESHAGLFALTYEHLLARMMDFTRYLESISNEYQQKEIPRTYVPLACTNGSLVDEALQSWLQREDSQPLAVLAGYGKGKTTLSWRFAKQLIDDQKRSATARVPILINLGDIATEQSVEGLLGKLLASDRLVRNYNFPLFQSWNRAGRFVIILDGFDEMKHGLSVSQFKYNFSQLLQLWTPKTKLVILGRPSVFQSEEEKQYCLRGRRETSSGAAYRELGWPEFQELEIADFTAEQLSIFVDRYFPIAVQAFRSETGARFARGWTKKRIGSIKSMDNFEVRRPIHARMLCEIAADPEANTNLLTLQKLYAMFVEKLVEREYAKPGRDRRIAPIARIKFAETLAWWMWTSHGLQSVLPDEIPPDLIRSHAYEGITYDLAALRRELVAGSFFEKSNQALYFSHRSLLEYLASEHLRTINLGDFSQTDQYFTEEVPKFLLEGSSREQIDLWFADYCSRGGAIQNNFSEFFARTLTTSNRDRPPTTLAHLWCVLLNLSTGTSLPAVSDYKTIVERYIPNSTPTNVAVRQPIALCIVWLLSCSLCDDEKLSRDLAGYAVSLWLATASTISNEYIDGGKVDPVGYVRSAESIARGLAETLLTPTESAEKSSGDEKAPKGAEVVRSRKKQADAGIRIDVVHALNILTRDLAEVIDLRKYNWARTERLVDVPLLRLLKAAGELPWTNAERARRLCALRDLSPPSRDRSDPKTRRELKA